MLLPHNAIFVRPYSFRLPVDVDANVWTPLLGVWSGTGVLKTLGLNILRIMLARV